jgi:adenylylsulfate kinase
VEGAFAVWLTGLPASGKSTVASRLSEELAACGTHPAVLESDAWRRVLTPDGTYAERERDAFYGALVEIGRTLADHGVPVVFDATANRRAYREGARRAIPRFLEVYVECPLATCLARDRKGTYEKARQGESSTVPGLQAAYEPPLQPELVVHGDREDPGRAARRILACLREKGFLSMKLPSVEEQPAEPSSGEAGIHPVGTAIGATGGAAAGAAIGSLGGLAGTVVGTAIGAVAGGLAGKGAAEAINPTHEHELGKSRKGDAMRCHEVMTNEVSTCFEADTVLRCAELMRDRAVGFVPVVDEDGRVSGVVTDRDLAVRVVATGRTVTTPVSAIMTRDVRVCHPGDDLQVAEGRMAVLRKSRLVVVDDFGRCLGVISLSDIAQADSRSHAADVLYAVTRREARSALRPAAA